MKIANCGYSYRHPSDFKISREKGSGDYAILVVRSKAYFILNGDRVIAEPSSAILYKKGTPQFFGAYETEYLNDWIHFDLEAEEAEWVTNALNIPFDKVISLYDVKPLSELIRKLFEEFYSQNKNAVRSSETYLSLVLMKLSDLKEQTVSERAEIFRRISEIRNRIFAEPQKNWNASDVSKELSLSCSYFQHLYKQYFGVSMKKDLTAARMEYAKYLLFSTNYTVSAISELCGYQNEVHFMRVFKDKIGQTPTKYRSVGVLSRNKVEESMQRNPFRMTSVQE